LLSENALSLNLKGTSQRCGRQAQPACESTGGLCPGQYSIQSMGFVFLRREASGLDLNGNSLLWKPQFHTIEDGGNGTIRIKFWKGDYLNRPDNTPTLGFAETGPGTYWTPEKNGSYWRFKSVKGDYLNNVAGQYWYNGYWGCAAANSYMNDFRVMLEDETPVTIW